jgi:hypothetical protein
MTLPDENIAKAKERMKQQQEPVAWVDSVWINRPDLAMDLGIGKMFSRCQLTDNQIPLYTKPQNLTLSDEEMDHSWFNYGEGEISKEALRAFVNSILNKASEK